MSEHGFQKQVQDGYQTINNRWMKIHVKLLLYCMAVSGIVEIIMFFLIFNGGTLNCSIGEYWFKYIIVPFLLNLFIVRMSYIILKNKNIAPIEKQYEISLLFVALAFVLELTHSGFVAVLGVGIFPILMSIMYENQKLTALISITSAITQAISGFFIFWDVDKLVDSSYKVNLFIILTITFCTWLTGTFMISFMKMKRKIIIHNDMERFRLQRDINIDGLTGIGNKLALLSRLDSKHTDFQEIKYLAMLDLDRFKEINDTYGHLFGDDVLRRVGYALRDMQGAESYRYGGDEFCIVFTDNEIEHVLKEIKKVQEYLSKSIETPDKVMNIYASVGIAGYSKGSTITSLLHHADEAMYNAKKNPPNGIIIYDHYS